MHAFPQPVLSRVSRFLDEWWLAILIVSAVVTILLTVVWSSYNWHRGIYAGFHYTDARAVASRALVAEYGAKQAGTMRLATPPVVNTHGTTLLQTGQIRVFHVIGRRGVKYCVSVWNPGIYEYKNIDIGGETQIKKGCTF